MAHAKGQHPQDPYAARGKALTSSVQRLRGWVGSDPSKVPELADALVDLTAHRLLGHGYAAAAADAQEAVRRSAELLAAQGPIGPYTSIRDAARYVTAVIQFGAIQAGLGMPDAAERTIDSLRNIHQQLGDGLLRQLEPQTVIWALLCSARAALVAKDVAAANAYADAARARLAESGLSEDRDAAYVAMDVDRLASDARWAAGRAGQAMAFLHAARICYDEVVDGRLQEPARLSPALLERLAEPLFGVYRDLADRLVATGEVDLGLATRRSLVELLRGLRGRLGDHDGAQLALALSDLARDLSASGRAEEAAAANTEAAEILPKEPAGTADHAAGLVSRGTQVVSWAPLPPDAAYAATTASAATTKIVDLAALQAELQQSWAAWLQTQRPVAQREELERKEHIRVAAERDEAEQAMADRAAAEKLAAERVQAEEAERLEAERQAAAEQAEHIERKRRREERIEAHRLEVERREAEEREAERLVAERLELERLQAQIDELERAEERGQGERREGQ
jgi:hypothetical protein